MTGAAIRSCESDAARGTLIPAGLFLPAPATPDRLDTISIQMMILFLIMTTTTRIIPLTAGCKDITFAFVMMTCRHLFFIEKKILIMTTVICDIVKVHSDRDMEGQLHPVTNRHDLHRVHTVLSYLSNLSDAYLETKTGNPYDSIRMVVSRSF